MITQKYNLNLIPNSAILLVKCSQFDKTLRTLTFDLFEGSTAFQIPSGTTATISGTKPDKTGFSYEMTVGTSSVSIDVTEQMTAVAGPVVCEITLTDGSGQISTTNFVLQVEPSALAGTEISETDIPIIQQAIEASETVISLSETVISLSETFGSPLVAPTAADMTLTNRVYVYTGSESGYTYGNWYYYNGSAWVSGGTYNAIVNVDTALSTTSTNPVQNKVITEEITDLKSAIQTLDDLLEVTDTPVEVTGTEYQGFYLNESSQIKSIANTAFRVIKYPVTEGVKYNVHGTQCKLPLAVYPMAGFDTVDFTGTETVACDETIIPSGDTNIAKDYDIDYVAPSDGYIYIWYSTTATANHLYVAEYVTASGRIKDKKPLKIQLFGDSITDDVWGDQTTWATILQDYMSDYDLTIINSAVAGSAIGYRGKSSLGRYADKTYNYVCDLMVDGTLDTTADVVVVLIGTNNYGGSYPRIGALGDCGVINEDQTGTGFNIYGSAQFITNKVATDTHALLLWVTPPQRYNTFDQSQPVNELGEPLNNLSYTLRELSDAIADCANFNGVPCLNLTASLGWNKRNVAYFTTDGLHPNTIGDEWLAQIISSEIKKHLHN